MKTTVINLEGIESALSPAGVEKQLCMRPGIHKLETNFMTGTATVYHDESMTLAEIKRYIAECGYSCSGECLPAHVCNRATRLRRWRRRRIKTTWPLMPITPCLAHNRRSMPDTR